MSFFHWLELCVASEFFGGVAQPPASKTISASSAEEVATNRAEFRTVMIVFIFYSNFLDYPTGKPPDRARHSVRAEHGLPTDGAHGVTLPTRLARSFVLGIITNFYQLSFSFTHRPPRRLLPPNERTEVLSTNLFSRLSWGRAGCPEGLDGRESGRREWSARAAGGRSVS